MAGHHLMVGGEAPHGQDQRLAADPLPRAARPLDLHPQHTPCVIGDQLRDLGA